MGCFKYYSRYGICLIYYQLSGNTEAANDALFDAKCDLIAALIPGYIAGLSKIRYLADVPEISKLKLSYLDDVLGPEDFSKISHMERGRLNEKRVLEAAGLQKNTKKYPGKTSKHGIRDVIPDAVTDNAFIEVKDVKTLVSKENL